MSKTDNDKTMRSVFVGNIPYEATEEQLKEIFQQVGPVTSFRIVYDRETGKPKGYGFCEYQDLETAQSAMRNLNDFDFHGRALRVGHAAGEQSNAEKVQAQAVTGPPEEELYGPRTEPEKAPEAISKAVASLPPEQMFELMKQMKLCIQNNPNEARNMLLQNPQLAYALLQAQIVMKIVDPQVALAMLHRQSEEIPPLMPSTNPAPVAAPVANNVPTPVAQPKQEPAPQQPGLLPLPQQSPNTTPTTLPRQTAPMDVDIRGTPPVMGVLPPSSAGPPMSSAPPASVASSFPSQGPPRGGLLGDRPHDPNFDNRVPRQPDRDQYVDRRGDMPSRGEPERFDDRYGGPRGPGGPPRGGYEGAGRGGPQSGGYSSPGDRYGGPPHGGPAGPGAPGGMMAGRPDPRGENRPDPRVDPRDPRSQRMPPTSMPGPRPGGPPVAAPRPQAAMPAPGMPAPRPAAPPAAAPAAPGQDQEKAALIMQVLQLTDDQIAMLPSEQRASILVLKEQIARSTGGT